MVRNFILCDMCLVHTYNLSTLEAELGVQSHLSYTLRSCFRGKKATIATATIKEQYLSHYASSGASLNIHGKKERKEEVLSRSYLVKSHVSWIFVLTFKTANCTVLRILPQEQASSRDTVNSEYCKKKSSSTILSQI